jgi:hypothetical protein
LILASYKPIIKIDKTDDVSYRILNGLAKNREYLIEKIDDHKRGLLIKIGQSTQSLEPEYPVIWHSPSRFNDKRFLKLPPEITIDEEPTDKNIFFKFKRRSIF